MIALTPDNYLLIERYLNELLLNDSELIKSKFKNSILILKKYYIRFEVIDIGCLAEKKLNEIQKLKTEAINNSKFFTAAALRDDEKILTKQIADSITINPPCFRINERGLLTFFNGGTLQCLMIVDCIEGYNNCKSLA